MASTEPQVNPEAIAVQHLAQKVAEAHLEAASWRARCADLERQVCELTPAGETE